MFLWRAPKVVWSCWGPWLWPWGLSLLFKEGTSPPRSVSLPPWPGYTWCVFIWWTYELRQKKQKQQNAQIQFAKCAPWRVHFELYGKKDKETKKGKLQKKQRKILAENSWLAKFVLTAKDVFDRNTNSQTLPEKKSLLSCILNFRNQLEDFTLTISCWRPCWCWWAAQVRSSLGPWGTLEGPWLVPPRSTTTLTQTSLLLAGRNTRRDQVRPKKNRWAWIELKFIQLTHSIGSSKWVGKPDYQLDIKSNINFKVLPHWEEADLTRRYEEQQKMNAHRYLSYITFTHIHNLIYTDIWIPDC